MAADIISDNCCLICSESFEWKPIPLRSKVNKDHINNILLDEEHNSGGGAGKNDIRNDFKTALLLFCKLLKANRNGFGGDEDDNDGEEEEWFRSLGNIYEKTFGGGGTFEPPCCSGCVDALGEILRLQKVIKASLASQREHVENLKGYLVVHGSLDSKNDDDGSCQVLTVRNRLISRIESNQHLGTFESRKTSEPETRRNSSANNESKPSTVKRKQICRRRRKRPPAPEDTSQTFSLWNRVKREENDGEQEDPLHFSDLEFETPSPNPPESIDGGDSRRQRKRKRNSGAEDLEILTKDFGLIESENGCAPEGDEEYQPSESVPITEEIPTSFSSDEPAGDEDDDSDYSPSKRGERKRKIAKSAGSRSKTIKSSTTPKKRRKRKSGIIPKGLGSPLFFSLSEDRLLYRSTLIKVSYGSGFTCEEEECGAFIPGSDFDAFQKLRNHISSSHENEEYYYKLSPCPLCSMPLRPSRMRRHMMNSHPSVSAICDVCWKPLRYSGIGGHTWLHKSAEEKQAVIDSGGRNFDLEMSKQREHQKSLPFCCDQCGKCCSSNANLESHKVSHVPTELRAKFECSQCDKIFLRESSLQSHIAVIHNAHLDSRPLVCRICGKRYHSQARKGFRNHMKSHEGDVERNGTHVCDSCGKVLSSKPALVRHLNTHTNERQFQCEFCQLAYLHKGNLQRHQASAHKKKVFPIDVKFSPNFRKPENMPGFIGPKLMYPCEVCGKAFPIRSRMMRHVETAHHREMF